MKRILALLLGLIMTVVFSSCGTQDNNGSATESATTTNGSEESGSGSASGKKILVAYFSASGNTEKVAEYIAEAAGGTLFKLVPENPYSSADLNWRNTDSRVNIEHNDESLRDIPLVTTTPENFEEYDAVFVGYPIWWGIAAWPVNNFVKNNDFTGKKVIPFATSSSSGLGSSGTLLRDMAGTGTWLSGQRFSSGASKSTVKKWVNGLNLAA